MFRKRVPAVLLVVALFAACLSWSGAPAGAGPGEARHLYAGPNGGGGVFVLEGR